MMFNKVRVLIVDDSAVVRNILTKGLSKDERLEIVGSAVDPYNARDLIVQLKPDVITLDLEMPKMDGLEFINILMKHWPIPIIVVSSLVEGNCEISIKALEMGALEIFPKPQADVVSRLPLLMAELAELVYNAASARFSSQKTTIVKTKNLTLNKKTDKVIAIGASTGGTEAIKIILEVMPSSISGIIIVQHMPEGFTKSYADRLNSICSNIDVEEAKNGDFLRQGLALIAPGNKHMLLKKYDAKYYVQIKQGPKVNRHRPSVDVLFHSVAESAGKNSVGALLTGMGADGAKGLLAMKETGAQTIAQDENTCVIYGMPREAIEIGAVNKIAPIQNIAGLLVSML
jgi:two-component system, chemotaxis family, protein-glutamate methylesterase/glutaminase